MKKLISLAVLAAFALINLCGCKSEAPLFEEELYALDTIITISVYSGSRAALDYAENEIRRLESLLSASDENSDIAKINESSNAFVPVEEETFQLIKTALMLSNQTDGCFDITVYPAVKLWGFTSSKLYIPTEQELLNVKSLIDYTNVELNEDDKSVRVPNSTQLDLGAIAKGFIADKAAEALINGGVTSAILNFGGNIRIIGSKPVDKDFTIGIKAPFSDGYFATVAARDITFSTAGGYERYFEKDSEIYHHIINPHTASPAETDVLSATVLGEKGELCDALATACFVLGSEQSKALCEKYPDYSFVFLTDDSVYVSKSLSDKFELSNTYSDYVIEYI